MEIGSAICVTSENGILELPQVLQWTKTVSELQTLRLIELYNIVQRFHVVHEVIVAITVQLGRK
jgi:hypothetical protein